MEQQREIKDTVSFRIKPSEKEEILAIGFDSLSRGVSTLLKFYRENHSVTESEVGLKIRAAERVINDIIKEYGESSTTERLRNQLKELKDEYLKRQVKDTRDIFRDIQRILA
jgi:hypothetical protein